MTLTIDDVAGWQPAQLTAAGGAAQTMSTDLDAAVRTAVDATSRLGVDKVWSGVAATAANTRMGTEQARASALSAALLELHTAFTAQVGNLENAKSKVLSLRAGAEAGGQCWADPGKHEPGFEVAPNGDVSADKRIAWYKDNLGEHEADRLGDQAKLDAARWHTDLVNALAQAEGVATIAQTTLATAVGKLNAAFDGLGDPSAVPAPTTPAAATPVVTSAPSSSRPAYTPASSSGSHGRSTDYAMGGGALSSGSSSAPTGPMPTGDVAKWIEDAKKVLVEMGYDEKDIDERAIAMMIQHESGGNPYAENRWDSNWLAGHPSKGIMQTIDGTFNAYKAPGHDDIWNPVDNIVAAVRYSFDRYGSLGNVPGVAAVNSGGAYQGY
ncbi:transglycosylase SLT domain-containing protein [Nocardia takedensis]|uniref:lytic transglycosylase domain-containing protein n=1 Tax=Nocardia takedensis TaxID=259390 RepID=UPI0003118FB9|nr:transglycosylase SLT domain-containing protein [Nocardia takedensis]